MKVLDEDLLKNLRLGVWLASGILNMIIVFAFAELLGYPVMETAINPAIDILTKLVNKTL